MEQNKERQHALTEIEAEISDLRRVPAPSGSSRRALRERADYYKQILDLYAEKEQMVQKSAEEMRQQQASANKHKRSRLVGWGKS